MGGGGGGIINREISISVEEKLAENPKVERPGYA